MKFRRNLFVVATALISCNSSAQEEAYFDETDLFTDIPMVSSGSRMEQTSYNSPSSVTVITSEMIRDLAPSNIVEIFRLAPSFISFYINGSLAGVSGHDSTDDDPRRIEVRINGRSVYLPSYPTINWEALGITPDDIERIELTRGSNVPAYGSNAIMGAVDIKTKSPLTESGTHVYTSVGSKNTRNVNIRSNFKLNNGYAQWRVSHRENTGFSGFKGDEDIPGTYRPSNSDMLDDDTRVDHIVFNSVFTPSLPDTFEFEFGYSSGRYGLGDGDRPDEFADDKNTSIWLNSSWTRATDREKWKSHISFLQSDSEQNIYDSLARREEWTPAELAANLAGNPDVIFDWGYGQRKAQSLEAETEYQRTINSDFRFVLGGGYKLQRLKAPLQIEGDDFIDNSIFYGFSNIEWHITDKWLTNIGFMLENQQIDETNLSPRVSLHYQIHPNHNLRLTSSKVYRAPSILEAKREQVKNAHNQFVDYHLMGSKLLHAEEQKELELAYYGSFFDGKVILDWRAFHEDMEGAIDHVKWRVDHQGWTASTDDNGKAYFFSNSKSWRATGYDLQLKWKPQHNTALYLQHTNTRLDSVRVLSWDYLPGLQRKFKVPEHTSSLLVSHKLSSGWSLSAMAYHQSFTDWRAGTEVDRFTRYDLSFGKMLQIEKYRLDLKLKIDNITNEEYEEYQNGNFFRRAAYLNASLHW